MAISKKSSSPSGSGSMIKVVLPILVLIGLGYFGYKQYKDKQKYADEGISVFSVEEDDKNKVELALAEVAGVFGPVTERTVCGKDVKHLSCLFLPTPAILKDGVILNKDLVYVSLPLDKWYGPAQAKLKENKMKIDPKELWLLAFSIYAKERVLPDYASSMTMVKFQVRMFTRSKTKIQNSALLEFNGMSYGNMVDIINKEVEKFNKGEKTNLTKSLGKLVKVHVVREDFKIVNDKFFDKTGKAMKGF